MNLIKFQNYPSTETPLNAENLNHNFNELNKKGNFIKVSMYSDLTLTSADMTIVKFDKVDEQLGDGLSLTEDGGIKIGKGISAIRVVGQAYYYTGTPDGIKTVYLYRNSAQISTTNYSEPTAQYTHLNTPSLCMKVNEESIIYLKVKGNVGDKFKNYNTGTFLTVEVIN